MEAVLVSSLLEVLIVDLPECRNLERLPNSFGNLIKLKYLDLSLCCNLTIETLSNINTLEYIDLSDCTKIEVLPPQVVHQRSLEKLDMSDTNLKELPSAIGELSDLEVLILGSPVLDTLPPSIGDLRNLKDLMLDHCKQLKFLPASVGSLNQLTRLRVRDCPLRELLCGERGALPALSNLDSPFHRCMPRLQYFRMSKIEIPELSFAEGIFPNLQHLHIQNCNHLVKVGMLPNTLIKLELDECSNLNKIKGLSSLAKIQMLHIWQCKEVEELAGIETLVSLEQLWASGCVKLKSIRGLAPLAKLQSLDVSQCSELEELENVEHCVFEKT